MYANAPQDVDKEARMLSKLLIVPYLSLDIYKGNNVLMLHVFHINEAALKVVYDVAPGMPYISVTFKPT